MVLFLALSDILVHKCIVKNITKAGIRAETAEIISPVVIFIARDHYHTDKYFSTIKNEFRRDLKSIFKFSLRKHTFRENLIVSRDRCPTCHTYTYK